MHNFRNENLHHITDASVKMFPNFNININALFLTSLFNTDKWETVILLCGLRTLIISKWLNTGRYLVHCYKFHTLTAFAVHVCVTFACQNAVFVRGSVEQKRNGDERVTAIRYPDNPFPPGLALLLHQLRQTLPQLLFLTADKHRMNHAHARVCV